MNKQLYNFYPGPSKLYPELKDLLAEAYDSGLLSVNHRSEAGMGLIKGAKDVLRTYLNVPLDYNIYFTSSATECWEICAQSLLRKKVHFFYNGAFGKKWFKYTVLNPSRSAEIEPRGSRYFEHQSILEIDTEIDTEAFCWVVSETSNGTQTLLNEISEFRELHPEALICLDATSSMGGREFDIKQADVWLASTQKCFGLPSGLGILIVSPKALENAMKIGEKAHYNSLLFIEENFALNQTPYTPNMLGIYLLKRLLETKPDVADIAAHLEKRAKLLYQNLKNIFPNGFDGRSEAWFSDTVICIKDVRSPEIISKAKAEGFIIGKGYGELKDQSFRIANFPAIEDHEYNELLKHLKQWT
jgi:phosphoserine aminotransferase